MLSPGCLPLPAVGSPLQATEQAQIESEAKLIAFDRQNHMGISSKTAQRIQEAITAEAATMHDAKGAKAVVSIKENEEKMKQLRVRRTGVGELLLAQGCVGRSSYLGIGWQHGVRKDGCSVSQAGYVCILPRGQTSRQHKGEMQQPRVGAQG